MDDREAGQYWQENAEVWTRLARQGWDIFRDHLNTPAFFAFLPEVNGLTGLDLGCGEGHNTRLLAKRGACMYAIDIAPAFLKYAREASDDIRYAAASGQRLPFPDSAFDFATAFLSLMDMPRPECALRETARVLKPGGFLQFSITHPFQAMEAGGYFGYADGEIDEWIFRSAPPEAIAGMRRFRIPRFQRTLSGWLNMIADSGLTIERALEPQATNEVTARFPKLRGTQVVPYFLHLRCRKPSAAI